MPKKVQRHRLPELNGEDVVACFTGFDSSQSCRRMQDTIERLGGTYQGHFTAKVTHLVANSTSSAKYQAALHLGIPVVNATWLQQSAEEGKFVDCRRHLRKPLEGCEVCVTGLSAAEKTKISAQVQALGGEYGSNLECNKTTHLVAEAPTGRKYEFATKWKVLVVSRQWLHECTRRKWRVPEKDFALRPGPLDPQPSTREDEARAKAWAERRAQCDTWRRDAEDVLSTTPEISSYLRHVSVHFLGFEDARDAPLLSRLVVRGGGTIFRHYFGQATYVLACPVAKTKTVRQMIDHGALVLTPQWLVATCRLGRAVACEPYLYELADDPDPAEPVEEETKPKPKPKPAPESRYHGIFSNKRVLLALPSKQWAALKQLETQIQRTGGITLTSNKSSLRVDIIVTVHGQMQYFGKSCLTVTPYWVTASLKAGRLLPVTDRILFRPLRTSLPLKCFQGRVEVCVSGYVGKLRQYIMHLVRVLGGRVSERFYRHSTHLVCSIAKGQKFERAHVWNVPVVNRFWLDACAAQGSVVEPTEFLVKKGDAPRSPSNVLTSLPRGKKPSPGLCFKRVSTELPSEPSPKRWAGTQKACDSTPATAANTATSPTVKNTPDATSLPETTLPAPLSESSLLDAMAPLPVRKRVSSPHRRPPRALSLRRQVSLDVLEGTGATDQPLSEEEAIPDSQVIHYSDDFREDDKNDGMDITLLPEREDDGSD